MMDRYMKIKIAMPFLLIIVSLVAVRWVHFKPSLSPAEARLLGFTPEKIDIYERLPFEVNKDLGSPIEITKKREFPSMPLSAIAPQVLAEPEKPLELKVSMIIVVGEGRRMAIVNGLVVREGESIGSARITKIEKDRLLIAERQKTRWIYMEGIK